MSLHLSLVKMFMNGWFETLAQEEPSPGVHIEIHLRWSIFDVILFLHSEVIFIFEVFFIFEVIFIIMVILIFRLSLFSVIVFNLRSSSILDRLCF